MPVTRRVVTSHDADGKAVFGTDELLASCNPNDTAKSVNKEFEVRITLVHRTQGNPVGQQGSGYEFAQERMLRSDGKGGIVCEVVDIPPSARRGAGLLHRNESLDYGVVLQGELTLQLEDGVEKVLKQGDTFVQRGTLHAWRNDTQENCRFFTVIVPAQKVKVERTGALLNATKVPGLTD